MNLKSPCGSFTFMGETIYGVDLSDHNKFSYIIDPKNPSLTQQPDPQPTIFSIDALFSDNALEQLLQATRSKIINHVSQESHKVFHQRMTMLKTHLSKLVIALDKLQSSSAEFYDSLLERSSTKLARTLERKLNSLKIHRDTLRNENKFPDEVDGTLETYLKDICSFQNPDFDGPLAELNSDLSVPFTSMEREANKIESLIKELQNKVRFRTLISTVLT